MREGRSTRALVIAAASVFLALAGLLAAAAALQFWGLYGERGLIVFPIALFGVMAACFYALFLTPYRERSYAELGVPVVVMLGAFVLLFFVLGWSGSQ